jgi:predicted TIM-barrel fold metal-dependent hydrolase
MIEAAGRIAVAVSLPVSADLEGGYGDPAETVRKAIAAGIVGANIEDRMRPLAEAAANVEKIMKVASDEGVDFVLNARTDAFVKAGDRDRAAVLADAVERGSRPAGPAPDAQGRTTGGPPALPPRDGRCGRGRGAAVPARVRAAVDRGGGWTRSR